MSDLKRIYSVTEQAASILKTLDSSLSDEIKLETKMSKSNDPKNRIKFIIKELEFLKKDTGWDPGENNA